MHAGGFQNAVITELSAQVAGTGPEALRYTMVDTAAGAALPACTASARGQVGVLPAAQGTGTDPAGVTLQFCDGSSWRKLVLA